MSTKLEIRLRDANGGLMARSFCVDPNAGEPTRHAQGDQIMKGLREMLPGFFPTLRPVGRGETPNESAGETPFTDAAAALAVKVAGDGKYMSPAEAAIVRTGMVLEWLGSAGAGEAGSGSSACGDHAVPVEAVRGDDFPRMLAGWLFGAEDGEGDD